MSHRAAAAAVETLRSSQAAGLRTIDRLVLLLIADRHNPDEGMARPSMRLLGEDAGVGERRARAAISRLETLGFLRRAPRQRDNGSQTANAYYLAGVDFRADQDDRPDETIRGGAHHITRPGRITATGRGGSSDPPQNQQLNQSGEPVRNDPIGGGHLITENSVPASPPVPPPAATPAGNEPTGGTGEPHPGADARFGEQFAAAFGRPATAVELATLHQLGRMCRGRDRPALYEQALTHSAQFGPANPVGYVRSVITGCLARGTAPGDDRPALRVVPTTGPPRHAPDPDTVTQADIARHNQEALARAQQRVEDAKRLLALHPEMKNALQPVIDGTPAWESYRAPKPLLFPNGVPNAIAYRGW